MLRLAIALATILGLFLRPFLPLMAQTPREPQASTSAEVHSEDLIGQRLFLDGQPAYVVKVDEMTRKGSIGIRFVYVVAERDLEPYVGRGLTRAQWRQVIATNMQIFHASQIGRLQYGAAREDRLVYDSYCALLVPPRVAATNRQRAERETEQRRQAELARQAELSQQHTALLRADQQRQRQAQLHQQQDEELLLGLAVLAAGIYIASEWLDSGSSYGYGYGYPYYEDRLLSCRNCGGDGRIFSLFGSDRCPVCGGSGLHSYRVRVR